MEQLENLLRSEVLYAAENGPTRLREAMLYAVFPGGGRVRPRLGLSMVKAAGGQPDDPVLGAAMAVELIHCASLVHDDMPCFDDSPMRRGKPSVHKAFGEDTALLVGDALISAAFGVLARWSAARPELLGPMVTMLADAVGASNGIIAGQAEEDDPEVSVGEVHRKKTGALFEAVAAMTALAMGEETERWRRIGTRLGAAYQIADDILDAVGDPEVAGKPVLQDAENDRPSAVRSGSLSAAVVEMDHQVEAAINELPAWPGRHELAGLLTKLAMRLCPTSLVPRTSRLTQSPYWREPQVGTAVQRGA